MRSAGFVVFGVYIALVLIPLLVVPVMMWAERRGRHGRGALR
jgi:hypothetical protein